MGPERLLDESEILEVESSYRYRFDSDVSDPVNDSKSTSNTLYTLVPMQKCQRLLPIYMTNVNIDYHDCHSRDIYYIYLNRNCRLWHTIFNLSWLLHRLYFHKH